MNPAGIAGALNYYEDGITPYLLFFKDGVVSEKFVSTFAFSLFFPPSIWYSWFSHDVC